jgi:hypothetical protein
MAPTASRLRVPAVYPTWADSVFLSFSPFNGINNLRVFRVVFRSIPLPPRGNYLSCPAAASQRSAPHVILLCAVITTAGKCCTCCQFELWSCAPDQDGLLLGGAVHCPCRARNRFRAVAHACFQTLANSAAIDFRGSRPAWASLQEMHFAVPLTTTGAAPSSYQLDRQSCHLEQSENPACRSKPTFVGLELATSGTPSRTSRRVLRSEWRFKSRDLCACGADPSSIAIGNDATVKRIALLNPNTRQPHN